jgi:hypothetical protein
LKNKIWNQRQIIKTTINWLRMQQISIILLLFLLQVTFVWAPYIGTIIFLMFDVQYFKFSAYIMKSSCILLQLPMYTWTCYCLLSLAIPLCSPRQTCGPAMHKKQNTWIITNEEILRNKKDTGKTRVKKESDIQFGN